ncbi:MAG TPA: metallophosphoesterase [Sphingomicrobium sp.]|nr:metallophosphoesterase [Sphingomicrobium sp.]
MLFRSLFPKDGRPEEPSVPDGYRVYAIGDIHGRLDLLDDALARIEVDIDSRELAQNIIVFLGDLIDRGPSSAQVVERVRTYWRQGVRTVFLIGNHEEVLIRLLRGESRFLRDWLSFGGAECAKSYGVSATTLKRMDPAQAVAALREKIPEDHRTFLQNFVDTFRIGSYLFVHAGIRPGVPLSEQNQTDLRWIREPFLENSEDHGFIVVHGHTINEQISVRENRIGLDTGAYRTGVLTAIGLEGRERWFVQTEAT